MSIYVNPSNENFAAARNDDIFVDKSMLIRFTNQLIGKGKNKVCVTRPRRFGKSMALDMLTAYYSRGCDSRALFQDLKIAQDPSFSAHLNKHCVIQIDVQEAWRSAHNAGKEAQWIPLLQNKIVQELAATFQIDPFPEEGLDGVLRYIHDQDNSNRFLFLMDEWDVLFRDPKVGLQQQEEYLSFLVSLFKGRSIESCIDMVYMTGTLPIIKYLKNTGNPSKLNNFRELSERP